MPEEGTDVLQRLVFRKSGTTEDPLFKGRSEEGKIMRAQLRLSAEFKAAYRVTYSSHSSNMIFIIIGFFSLFFSAKN